MTAVVVIVWSVALTVFVAAHITGRLRPLDQPPTDHDAGTGVERVRAMDSDALGRQPAVRVAEHIVYAAWTRRGQRRP